MILKTLLVTLAGGAALWKLSSIQQRQRIQRSKADRKPPAENSWEGEGGALRDSGSQLGPEPSVVKPA